MDVVYADLRFSRKAIPPQKVVTPESPCDDWEVTYENVTPLRDIQGGEEESPPQAKGPKGFFAGRYRYVLVTLGVISLISLIVIITLSTQLSLVTRRYDGASVTLKILRQEREHLNSSLTRDILRKDSVVRGIQEALRRAEVELTTTKNDLWKSREEGQKMNLKLQRTVQEKAEADTAINDLTGDLRNTQNQLQEKSSQLTRCDDNLRAANSREGKNKREINELKTSLSSKERRLKVVENSLSQKERELVDARRTVSDLQKDQKSSEPQLQKLRDLEEKLSVAKDCFSKSCHEGGAYEEDSDAYCPGGWKQIDDVCYYFSSGKDTRIKADEDCKRKDSTLAKIRERDSALKATIKEVKKSFWIGLSKDSGTWKWSDGSLQDGFQLKQGLCAKASPALESYSCSSPLPWICQINAMKCRLTPEKLRCFFEKIGIFGEKINTYDAANSYLSQDVQNSITNSSHP